MVCSILRVLLRMQNASAVSRASLFFEHNVQSGGTKIGETSITQIAFKNVDG